MNLEDAQVWSCGGGTQSGAIAFFIGEGLLPKPDHCFMIDTQRERSSTWPFVDGFIRPQLARVGLTLHVVRKDAFTTVDLLSTKGAILLPGFTTHSGSIGKLPGWCSGSWKQEVSERYLRSLGVKTAKIWIGISTDELRRVRRPHRPWLIPTYPLVYLLSKSRLDCVAAIRSTGYKGDIPHSACWMCPNLADEEWSDMKRDTPEDFAQAVKFDLDMREIDPHFWIHESCKPLGEVDFTAQQSMFPDRGCTGGCFT